MKQFIEETLKELEAQVENNIRLIDQKQTEMDEMFGQLNAEGQKEKFDLLFSEIKNLMTENSKFIHMQLILISYLEKIKGSDETIDETELLSDLGYELPTEEVVVFDMTIQGELPFDQHHPMFNDKKFFNKLLDHYTSIEAYEKCSELTAVRSYLSHTPSISAGELLNKAHSVN
jgi:hypothetical protein